MGKKMHDNSLARIQSEVEKINGENWITQKKKVIAILVDRQCKLRLESIIWGKNG